MLGWCIILFGLGVVAFLDTIFNYGDIFRRVSSVVFMLISLGLLVRLSTMTRLKEKETLREANEQLKNQSTSQINTATKENQTANVS